MASNNLNLYLMPEVVTAELLSYMHDTSSIFIQTYTKTSFEM